MTPTIGVLVAYALLACAMVVVWVPFAIVRGLISRK